MKKILITGEKSYIGTSLVNWLTENSDYKIDLISVRGNSWLNHDFSAYDTLVHVAGLAHRKETTENKHLYNEVNYELVKKISDKAKSEGIKHFIFMSSMSVYGARKGDVSLNTELNPNTYYGKSKLKAEHYLESIKGENFLVTIVRPPMVYGKGCQGNYNQLAKFAKISPFFPEYDNKRSMIFIDNLNLYLELIIKHEISGVVYPQNKEYVKTSDMVKTIAKYNNRKLITIRIMNRLIKYLTNKSSLFFKVFGSLYYDKTLEIANHEANLELNKRLVDFNKSIKITES